MSKKRKKKNQNRKKTKLNKTTQHTTIKKVSSVGVVFYGFDLTSEVVNSNIENILDQDYENYHIYALITCDIDNLIISDKIKYIHINGDIQKELTDIQYKINHDYIAYKTIYTQWYNNHLSLCIKFLQTHQLIVSNIEYKEMNLTEKNSIGYRIHSFENLIFDDIMHKLDIKMNWMEIEGHDLSKFVKSKMSNIKIGLTNKITIKQFSDTSRADLIDPIEDSPTLSSAIKTNELVTVIIPGVGNVEIIRESINIVFKQTYKNVEVLIPATLNSPVSMLVDEMGQLYNGRVKILFLNNTDDYSHLIQYSLQHSQGLYIYYLHPGHTWYPKHIENHIYVFQQNNRMQWQITPIRKKLSDEKYFDYPLNNNDPRLFVISGFCHRKQIPVRWQNLKIINPLGNINDFYGGITLGINNLPHCTTNEISCSI